MKRNAGLGTLIDRSTVYRNRSRIMPTLMDLDIPTVARWIEAVARRPGEIADVFVETLRQVTLEWRDGQVTLVGARSERGVSARCHSQETESLAFVSGSGEAKVREAVRALQLATSRPPLPFKPAPPDPAAEEERPLATERWSRRLSALLARQAPRHHVRSTLTETERQVIPAHAPASTAARRLVSVEGTLIAASRRGDETRVFRFHAPDAESTAEELRSALVEAARPREPAVPCGQGEMDVVLANGCAAVLFHEILSHPLEAGERSPFSPLEGARLASADLEVRDDPTRLDLFGGYERDDEGVRPRSVKLLDAGRLAGWLTDRAHAARGGSNGHARRAGASDAPLVRGANLLVAAGQASSEEMLRRLGTGLWIEQLDQGSIELESGFFRLHFPHARRIRRGRIADECGAGVLAGDVLSTLKAVEPGLGREVRIFRPLAWCAREGQVIPVGGAAPEVLIRKLHVRPI